MVQEKIQLIAGGASIWGVSITGWLGLLQPWLTALATIAAVVWSVIQIYYKIKNEHAKSRKE